MPIPAKPSTSEVSKVSAMKTLMKTFLTITCSLIWIGCSGGGDSDYDNTTAANTTSTNTIPNDSNMNNTEPDDDTLQSDIYDNLRSTYTLDVEVDLDLTGRAYISICNGDGVTSLMDINYEDCLLRSPLTNGKLNHQIKVANHLNNLVAAIWQFDGSENQMITFKASSDQEQSFVIE